MTRSWDHRKDPTPDPLVPSLRGNKRLGPIRGIVPGDHVEVAREIARLWEWKNRLKVQADRNEQCCEEGGGSDLPSQVECNDIDRGCNEDIEWGEAWADSFSVFTSSNTLAKRSTTTDALYVIDYTSNPDRTLWAKGSVTNITGLPLDEADAAQMQIIDESGLHSLVSPDLYTDTGGAQEWIFDWTALCSNPGGGPHAAEGSAYLDLNFLVSSAGPGTREGDFSLQFKWCDTAGDGPCTAIDGAQDGDMLVWLDGAWAIISIVGVSEGDVLTIVSGFPTWAAP